ncbi:hypothetical protein [Desulfohalovibrio reitneri]|uniref:hypothetical protein n=1 Tax=Desulfohalovibrio reitneri TaxID=1307759 RepID=UPI0004A6F136|nr:hypothetical protein [Desulfohalovibrio reitneri]
MATVRFTRCTLYPLKYQRDTEEMVSTVFYEAETEKGKVEDSVDVMQKVGTEFQKAPLKVALSEVSVALFDEEAFKEEALKYYRDCWAAPGEGMRTMGAPADFEEDRIFVMDKEVDVPAKS